MLKLFMSRGCAMDRLKLMRSTFLAIALLWQCFASFFPACANPIEDHANGMSSQKSRLKSFALLQSALPAFLEVKRLDSPIKSAQKQTAKEFCNAHCLNLNSMELSLFKQSTQSNFTLPIKRGYWLLFCSLKL